MGNENSISQHYCVRFAPDIQRLQFKMKQVWLALVMNHGNRGNRCLGCLTSLPYYLTNDLWRFIGDYAFHLQQEFGYYGGLELEVRSNYIYRSFETVEYLHTCLRMLDVYARIEYFDFPATLINFEVFIKLYHFLKNRQYNVLTLQGEDITHGYTHAIDLGRPNTEIDLEIWPNHAGQFAIMEEELPVEVAEEEKTGEKKEIEEEKSGDDDTHIISPEKPSKRFIREGEQHSSEFPNEIDYYPLRSGKKPRGQI